MGRDQDGFVVGQAREQLVLAGPALDPVVGGQGRTVLSQLLDAHLPESSLSLHIIDDGEFVPLLCERFTSSGEAQFPVLDLK
jgi:hypothetical protein